MKTKDSLSPFIFASVASLLLSFWIVYRTDIINPDAICYLLSAEMIGKSGLNAAMHLCGQAVWPFYSALIFAFVKISHLSYPMVAYFLDGLFSLSSVLFFILIVKELGGSTRVIWCAVMIILLAHQFNSVREYIIRDHGFWTFYLGSIFFLLKFFRKPSLTWALLWNGSLFIATLFRIEGLIFLLSIPILSLIIPHQTFINRVKNFCLLNIFTFFLCLLLFAWLAFHHFELRNLGRIPEFLDQVQHGLLLMWTRYQTGGIALANHVLPQDSAHEAGLILLIVLIAWYSVNLVMNLSIPFTLLALFAWIKKLISPRSHSTFVLGAYFFINLVITFGFLLEHFFLSKRYLIAINLLIMLWVPFALDYLIAQWNTWRHRVALIVLVFLIFGSALGGIFDFGYSKAYIRNAGNWIANNVPADALLYTNDYQLMYYSRHFGDELFSLQKQFYTWDPIKAGGWRHFHYLAFRIAKNNDAERMKLLQEIPLKPHKIFSNKRGDAVVIYKV